MKYYFASAILVFFLGIPSTFAQTYEHVSVFESSMTLLEDGRLFVREDIFYDFGTFDRHGIYRYIPTTMNIGGALRATLGIEILPIAKDGTAEQVAKSIEKGNVFLKIGDPNVTISGLHQYTIPYRVERLLVNEPQGQRLSWNVTGNGWDVSMEEVRFTLDVGRIPDHVTCFTGEVGSVEQACTVSTSGTQVFVHTTRELMAREGVSVDAWFPPGSFAAAFTKKDPPLVPPWILFSAAYVGLWALAWFLIGRDAKGRGTIVAEYAPPADVKPYEAAALANHGVNSRAFAAFIMDLVRRGELRLRPMKEVVAEKKSRGESNIVYDALPEALLDLYMRNTYVAERLPASKAVLDPLETQTLNKLFFEKQEITFGQRDKDIGTAYRTFLSGLEKQLITRGWHKFRIGPIRGGCIVGSVVLWHGLFIYLLDRVIDPLFFWSYIGLVLSLPFGYLMPHLTAQGALALDHLKGFKKYIEVAEKDRLAFHEGPKATPERFSTLLPYAVGFHLEKAWAGLFTHVNLDTQDNAFRSMGLSAVAIGSLSGSLASSVGASIQSSTSSGAGGSSGGGGGGGGGGSW